MNDTTSAAANRLQRRAGADRHGVFRHRLAAEPGRGLPRRLVLAVLANICYCAAYLGDVFVQMSGLRESWTRWRWALFVIGTVFAAIIPRWFAMGFFTLPHPGR